MSFHLIDSIGLGGYRYPALAIPFLRLFFGIAPTVSAVTVWPSENLALLEEPARALVGVLLQVLDGRVGRGITTAATKRLGDSAAGAAEAEASPARG